MKLASNYTYWYKWVEVEHISHRWSKPIMVKQILEFHPNILLQVWAIGMPLTQLIHYGNNNFR
jgi:hypothetical protein